MNMCHSSKSQSCHSAVFVNLVARSSTDEFFTLCHVHLEHGRVAQAASLQRRHELLTGTEAVGALWQVLSLFGPTLQESCGSHCRRGLSRGNRTFKSPYHTISYGLMKPLHTEDAR